MDGEPIENQKNQGPKLLLTDDEWWARPASARLIEAVGARAGSTVAEVFDAALEKLNDRPEDLAFDRLREIFLRVEPFLEVEDRDYLRGVGLLRGAPRGGEFRARTQQQLGAEERASAELLSKFEQMDESDRPQRERASRVIQSLAVRGRITSEERTVLVGRGLLDEDFEA